MLNIKKNRQNILEKLNIDILNPMQLEAESVINKNSDIILLSPTGTGKTLAYLLPVIEELDSDCNDIQLMILVPSRELAMQIEQVIREMGTGFKTNAVYGGQAGSKDKTNLKHRPAILIGTPGRISDHIRRENFPLNFIKTLVLDEFDKSLEVGFENEMKEIVAALPNVQKRILTSATQKTEIPAFVGMRKAVYINYLHQKIPLLKIKTIISPTKDKLRTLVESLCFLGNKPGIIFCNFKESIDRLSDFLNEKKIQHACFYGGMEQIDRERALIKFRNGTHHLLLATDLAARGLDIPELKFIIHYHLPNRAEEFIHRNGRTARMNSDGTAYVLKYVNEDLPDFIKKSEVEEITKAAIPEPSKWETVYISGGRRDKISKGDIAGLFIKQAHLLKDEIGIIEIKQDSAYVAVCASRAEKAIKLLDNCKLKTKKVRISII